MSKKTKPADDSKEVSELISQYQNDKDAIQPIHDEFEEKENILLGVPKDSMTVNETRSRVQDPTMLSAIIKQNNATMAQMPTGQIKALSVKNRGKALFMDLAFHNHVLPQANSQFDVYTKLWLLSFYRKVYGSMGVLVDYVVKPNYVGPDFTLVPARSIIPQAGKTSINDSDRVFIKSKVSKKWLESRDDKIWKNIDKALKSPHNQDDSDEESTIEQKYKRGQFKKDDYEIITRYEADRWVTFSKDASVVLRDIPNPQKNQEIPVVMCHSYPLLDRFFGLGEFERGKTLHFAMSSLINLYLDGVKMSIFPPLKLDPSSIADWNSFQLGPGSVWLMRSGQLAGIEQMQLSPQGLNTFTNTYSFLKGAMLTLTNSTDTSISQDQDVGFGKTPQALKMQAAMEGAKTGFDRKMLEIATEQTFDKMVDLIAKRQEQPMKLYLEGEDLKKVAEVSPDVVEMFEEGDMGQVVIKPKDVANCEYRYEIDGGSTVKKDEMMENATITELIGLVTKIPGAMEQIAQGGVFRVGNQQIEFGEMIKRWIISSGITDWDKIVTEVKEPDMANFEDPALQQAFQGMNPGQPPQGMPPQGMPQGMPPMPQQQPQQFQDPQIAQVMAELQSMAQG